MAFWPPTVNICSNENTPNADPAAELKAIFLREPRTARSLVLFTKTYRDPSENLPRNVT